MAVCSSETSLSSYKTAWRQNLGDSVLFVSTQVHRNWDKRGEISGSYGHEYEDDSHRDMVSSNLVEVDQRFRGVYCFHHHCYDNRGSMDLWHVSLLLWSYKTMRDFKFSRRRVWCSELSSGIYCRVKWLSTDVSEVHTASIIRDESIWNVGRQSFYTAVYPRRQLWTTEQWYIYVHELLSLRRFLNSVTMFLFYAQKFII
jgi:hypothetical protein